MDNFTAIHCQKIGGSTKVFQIRINRVNMLLLQHRPILKCVKIFISRLLIWLLYHSMLTCVINMSTWNDTTMLTLWIYHSVQKGKQHLQKERAIPLCNSVLNTFKHIYFSFSFQCLSIIKKSSIEWAIIPRVMCSSLIPNTLFCLRNMSMSKIYLYIWII